MTDNKKEDKSEPSKGPKDIASGDGAGLQGKKLIANTFDQRVPSLRWLYRTTLTFFLQTSITSCTAPSLALRR